MTVSSLSCRSGPYACDGVNKLFVFDFPVKTPEHLAVFFKDGSTGLERELALYADFSVSVAGSQAGGFIECNETPPEGGLLTVLRRVPIRQDLDLVNNDAFYAESVEGAFDYLTMICQQQQEALERSVKVSPVEDVGPDHLLSDIKNMHSEVVDGVARTASDLIAVNSARERVVDAELDVMDAKNECISARAEAAAARDAAKAASDSSVAAWTAVEEMKSAVEASEHLTAASASDALGSADRASGFASDAASFAETVQAAVNSSETAREKARAWAEEDVDVQVEPGRFSARHWAEKARIDGSIGRAEAESLLSVKAEKGLAVLVDLNSPNSTFTAGGWRTRVLNHKAHDSIGVTLSNNHFSLPAGEYLVEWAAPAMETDRHQTRLCNVDDGLYSPGTYHRAVSVNGDVSYSTGSDRICIADAKNFRLEHRCHQTGLFNCYWDQADFGDSISSRVTVRKLS